MMPLFLYANSVAPFGLAGLGILTSMKYSQARVKTVERPNSF